MSYRIKEIYFTQQGEGKNTGKNFVFVRFSGCNLWSGKEKNRESAICKFCDTDFYGVDGVNGGIYEAKELVKMIKSLWMVDSNPVSAVLTGGEKTGTGNCNRMTTSSIDKVQAYDDAGSLGDRDNITCHVVADLA